MIEVPITVCLKKRSLIFDDVKDNDDQGKTNNNLKVGQTKIYLEQKNLLLSTMV